MKSHVLDYVFKFHRQKIQSNTSDKTKFEEYIYDLENTWSINTEILITILKENNNYTKENKSQLCAIIDKIQDLVEKKKSLRENKMKMRGKLLMDKQIMEEYKRRYEENNVYYSEQIDEFKENLDKKESFIKQFFKKFKEVEIFVQRESKNRKHKWENLENFEIIPFINQNEELHKKKLEIIDEMNSVRYDMNEILRENVELKKREEYIDISDDNIYQPTKYETLLNNYMKKIKYFEKYNENLKSVLKNLTIKLDKISGVSKFRLNQPVKQHQRNISMSIPRHKKMNSKPEIFFSNLNVQNQNEKKEENNSHLSNKIIEDVNEHNDEPINEKVNDELSIEVENEKKDEEEKIQNQSILVFSPVNKKNKVQETVQNQSIWVFSPVNKINKEDFFTNNDYQSIFNQNQNGKNTAEISFTKEHWDVSCIENV